MKRMTIRRDSRDGWYSISPEDAEHLLKSDPIKNRPIGPTKVHRITEKIRNGKWVANGESIILDPSGKLADGQHRLSACIAAGKAIESYIVHIPAKLKESFFDSVDQGAVRSGSDLLAMDGVIYSTCAAAVCRLLSVYEGGNKTYGSGKGRWNYSVRDVYQAAKQEIDQSIEAVMLARKETQGWVRPSTLSFAYLMARRTNKDRADKWLNAVVYGEGLEANHPAMRLRKVLMADALSKASKHYDLDSEISLTTKSWVMFNHGVKPSVLTWSKQEDLPRFDDRPSRLLKENLAKAG